MEVHWWTPKDMKSETKVGLCYTKMHKGETNKYRPIEGSTIPEKVEIENSMCRHAQGPKKMMIYIITHIISPKVTNK